MIYPEIIEIEARRKELDPPVNRKTMCDGANMSDETYRLWLKGTVSPSLEKVHSLRAELSRLETLQRALPASAKKKSKKSKRR